MAVSGVGMRSSGMLQSLVAMRRQLDDLQRQLGTGKKSDTYAGLGLERGMTVGLRSQLSALTAYGQSMNQIDVTLNLAQQALTQIGTIAQNVKTSAFRPIFTNDGSGQSTDQKVTYSALDQALGLLNIQAGDRYVFSGKAVDQPAVETTEHIINGDGARAGLRQVIAERRQADLGASGLGRVAISAPNATSAAVTEDAVSPFGFKIAGITSNLTNAVTSGPAGAPAGISVDLGAGNPVAGDTLKLTFALPDGSTESVTLTATNASPPGSGQFTIGANAAATATNLRAALTTAIGGLAATALPAASALAAGRDFFSDPPQRVAGPPFNTATAMVAGTGANTVNWYIGEDGGDPARATAAARIDQSLTVQYGMRGNEQALRNAVQNIAVFAAVTFAPNDANATVTYSALSQRIGAALDGGAGQQKISDIQAELAGAQNTMAAAKDRHQQTTSTLTNLLQKLEGVPNDEVAAQVLALQTSLQASLQATAMLYRTSILNYL